jgi:saccharopine dehydrogenase (NAD+, L-lysine-forming)
MSGRWMIYGASGYTGELCAELARRRGHEPVLAGRSADKVGAVARRLELPSRVFGLDDPAAVRAGLDGIAAVLHTAGPFSATSRAMVDACLAARASYLDVTGEIDVFEAVLARGAEAERAGVALVPGVGFDVVPTDALAAMLAERLPAATHLELAFAGLGAPSRGTLKTTVEGLSRGGRARIDGRIEPVPAAWRTRSIRFADRERTAVSIPWGDVCTAWHTTGIPNITVYMAMPERQIAVLRHADRIGPLLGARPVQALLKKLVDLGARGPSEAALRESRSEVWGEVRDARGGRVVGTMSTPGGYPLTADSSLRAVERVLAGVRAGAHTPTRAFGKEFVLALDGVIVHDFAIDTR